jgi:hypothetical protein
LGVGTHLAELSLMIGPKKWGHFPSAQPSVLAVTPSAPQKSRKKFELKRTGVRLS